MLPADIRPPEKKAYILFAAGALTSSGTVSNNRMKTVFSRWRRFLLTNHPDRNSQIDDTNIRIITDGSGGDIGPVNQADKHLRHAIFAIAFLAHLGVFKQNAMNSYTYNGVEDARQFIRTNVTRFNILAGKEKKDLAKNALGVLMYREPFNALLKKEFLEWDSSNSKARSRSAPRVKSRARSRTVVSKRRNGRLLLRGPSAARVPESMRDITLSLSRSPKVKTKAPRGVKKATTKQRPTTAEIDALNARKPCPDRSKVRWPPTNRCRKVKPCPIGKIRNPLSGRCKKVRHLKPCKQNQRRHPDTNRCRKIK